MIDGKVFDYFGGSWPQNTVIYAYGAASTSIEGKITDTSYSNTFSGIKFTNFAGRQPKYLGLSV